MFGGFGQQQQNQPQQPQSTTGLFGSTTTQLPAFGGFGQAQQQQQQQQQQQPTQQQNPTGGLFGAQTNQNQGSQPAQSSLFGGFGQNQTRPAGGLFGSTTTPATGGGLFGATAPAQQPATGGLFGNTAASNTNPTSNPATQPTTTAGLFGSTATTQQTQQTGGLFGGAQPTQTPSGLFGNTQPAQTQTQPSLFGQAQTQQQPVPTATTGLSIFGQVRSATTPLGGPPLGATQPSSGTTSTDAQISGSTKFNDLPEQLKKILEAVDGSIQKQTYISQDLKTKSLGAEPEKGLKMAHQVAKTTIATTNTLALDERFVKELREKVQQAINDAVRATRIIEGWQNPAQFGSYLGGEYVEFPFRYFEALAIQLRDRLQRYKVMVEQIERKLASATDREQFSPQTISTTLRAQHQTFMALAAKTAEIHGQLQRIKDVYRTLWRTQTGSARDPFDRKSDMEGLPVGGLAVN